MKEHDELCEAHDSNVENNGLERIKDRMPDEGILCELSDFFRILGDSTRVRILQALMYESLCVCDIASALDMTVSAISHQLRVLRQAKMVRTRREGKQVFYAIDDHHIGILLAAGLEHVREGRPL